MRIAVILAVGFALTMGVVHAQSDDDEDEMDAYPLVPSGNLVHFGLRFVGGPKVSFGHLGIVQPEDTVGDSLTVENRQYNDGYVFLDGRRDRNGNAVNDGFSNSWNYTQTSQVTPGGDIALHSYRTNSTGAGIKAKSGSAAGWEVRMGHSFGRIARKIDFSIVAGFSFSDVNAKTSGDVPAELLTLTDVYSLNGQPVPLAPYTAPSTTTISTTDASGNPVNATRDNTTLIANVPIGRTTSTGATSVHGRWQIKGAYYTMRIGPMLQFPITERLKVSLSFGAGVAYAGTDYLVTEDLDIPDTQTTVQVQDTTARNAWLPCLFADADAEYWLTERTGLYLGAAAQKSGSYDQTLDGRTAKIDLGSTYGVTSGITLRF